MVNQYETLRMRRIFLHIKKQHAFPNSKEKIMAARELVRCGKICLISINTANMFQKQKIYTSAI